MPIVREREVTGFAGDDTGVDVELRRPVAPGAPTRRVRRRTQRGRKAAGNDFVGWDPTTSWLIAEVEMAEEQLVDHPNEPTLQDLREALIVAYGTDYGVHGPTCRMP